MPSHQIQLVVVSSLFIASKMEEVVMPPLERFVYMANNAVSAADIVWAEEQILNWIQFSLSYPNPLNFLRRVSKADGYDHRCRTLAGYLLEVAAVDGGFIDERPSFTVAVAFRLARELLDRGPWVSALFACGRGHVIAKFP